MGETEGQGTAGGGCRVIRGTALGEISVWEQEQGGPPGEKVWWGHNEKKVMPFAVSTPVVSFAVMKPASFWR